MTKVRIFTAAALIALFSLTIATGCQHHRGGRSDTSTATGTVGGTGSIGVSR